MGSPVFDLHFHLRPQPANNLAHLDGAGVTKANLLTRGDVRERVEALQAAAPGRFTWFNSYDVSAPDAEQVLTRAVKAGAQGFGQMKFHVAADGPELSRIYAIAADLGVPILIGFRRSPATAGLRPAPHRRQQNTGDPKRVAITPVGLPERQHNAREEAHGAHSR